MERLFRKILPLLVISLLLGPFRCEAQPAPTLSNTAARIKHKVSLLTPGDKISVVRRDASESFGTYLAMSEDEFSFYDVDLKTEVHQRFEDVRRIRNGFGGYNTIKHKHTDRTRGLLTTAAIVVGVAVILGVALSHDR